MDLFPKVIVPADEEHTRPFDYTQDYRRFAYKDFSIDQLKNGSNISPEALLKWVLAAKPRSQDDVFPIMQLCKGILKDLMEERIGCRQSVEDALQSQLDEVRAELQRKVESEQRLKEQAVSLQREIDALQAQTMHQEKSIADAHAAQIRDRDAHIAALEARLEDATAVQAELGERAEELERKLRSATVIAEQRAKDFFRAHNSLTARLQMTPRDTVGSWGLDEQREALRCLLQEHRKCADSLRAADLQAMPVPAKQDLVRKLLESIRVAAPSWLRAVAEIFDCPPARLLDKVAAWYQQEHVTTDAVKYQHEVGVAV